MITVVELLVIKKAIQNLQTIGCNVGVVDKDGNQYGGFKLAPLVENHRKRAAPVHKRGTLCNYIDPYLSCLTEAGDVMDVPMSPLFDTPSKLNSAISAYMCNRHGKGSCKIQSQPELQSVRVYRL